MTGSSDTPPNHPIDSGLQRAGGLPEPAELDAFLRDLRALELEAVMPSAFAELGVALLSDALDPLAPAPAVRAKLLAGATLPGRLAHLVAATAKLLDVGIDRAQQLLDQLDDATRWVNDLPGASFFWVEGGPAVAGAVQGFLKVPAGTHFPVHQHQGDEWTLVLQGSVEDPGRGLVLRPGDIDFMPAGSSHDYIVPAGGPDLLQLAVVHTAIHVPILNATF